jgi:hypothetical protein
VTAGGSQAASALSAALTSSAHLRLAQEAGCAAYRHFAGASGERRVCRALGSLALQGVHHLDDRRWRGGGEANVDHLAVGPQGVFVIDAKNWTGRIEVKEGQLRQNGDRRDERLIALRWAANRVDEVLAATGIAVQATPVVCFTRPSGHLPRTLERTWLTDEARLADLVTARPVVLSALQVAEIVALLAYSFPAYDVDPTAVAQAEGALFGEEIARHAGLDAVLKRPVEDWMIWLHPEQASVARRPSAGPARIRGAAGTGKTVVALHRLAWLAESRPGQFLVTSYVRTLPGVLERSYARLSPQTRHRVDFVGLHRFAFRLLADRRRPVDCDAQQAVGAFDDAWRQCRDGLAHGRLTKDYYRDEVGSVIKGRGLEDLGDYLHLDRVGRRVPLAQEQRRAVWALAQAYDRALAARGVVDFNDVLRLARDEVRREPLQRPYAGVIVDEVQDLPLVGLQLAYELAGRDKPDGLLLVGDGQQAIYPGGVRLTEAGISVQGRAVVLRVNYRNTVEVLAAARGVVAGDAFDDLDAAPESGDRDVEVVRHGELPSHVTAATVADHDAALLWDLHVVLARPGVDLDDVTVLCDTNARAKRYAELLRREGIASTSLDGDAGRRRPAVRVGTYHRAKGLEFKHVFLPLCRTALSRASGGEDARGEQEELARRQLFVAMTRARDSLWIGDIAE